MSVVGGRKVNGNVKGALFDVDGTVLDTMGGFFPYVLWQCRSVRVVCGEGNAVITPGQFCFCILFHLGSVLRRFLGRVNNGIIWGHTLRCSLYMEKTLGVQIREAARPFFLCGVLRWYMYCTLLMLTDCVN